MNKKGFTLIELLVTIIILGLVLYMGFPSLMALINDNKTKEFEYYGDLMIDAAKLYSRKESVDWVEASNGSNFTKKVYLSNLITNEYITPYRPTKDNLWCDQEHAYVYIEYSSDTGTYKYSYDLLCKDKSSKKKYTKKYNSEEFVIENY